jgi:hypothetical protein
VDVDVNVHLGSMPPWLDDSPGAAEVWSVGPNLDEHGNPTRMVWRLGDGEYFRYLYSDGTEFLLDRRTRRPTCWAPSLAFCSGCEGESAYTPAPSPSAPA